MVRKITYASARNKGKNYEREIAKALKNIGVDARRTPMSGALSWLKGDVTESNTIHPHVHECKNQQVLCLNEWWRQAVAQALEDEIPVLHFTSNYQGKYTVLTSTDFDEMLSAHDNYRPELSLNVRDFPCRKNFWKFIETSTSKFEVYLYQFDEENELVIMLLEVYLKLRKYDIKRRAEELLS